MKRSSGAGSAPSSRLSAPVVCGRMRWGPWLPQQRDEGVQPAPVLPEVLALADGEVGAHLLDAEAVYVAQRQQPVAPAGAYRGRGGCGSWRRTVRRSAGRARSSEAACRAWPPAGAPSTASGFSAASARAGARQQRFPVLEAPGPAPHPGCLVPQGAGRVAPGGPAPSGGAEDRADAPARPALAGRETSRGGGPGAGGPPSADAPRWPIAGFSRGRQAPGGVPLRAAGLPW